MNQPKPLKGVHVLAMIVAFFAAIFIANGIFLTLALRTFPGVYEKKSYVQGLRFNDKLEAKRAQEALSWAAAIDSVNSTGEATEIALAYQDSRGVALDDLFLTGEIGRPASDQFDRTITFENQGNGVYSATIEKMDLGVWRLQVIAVSAAGDQFQFETDLYLK